MVSKALVIGAYQRKLEELARLPDVALTAIVPPFWREGQAATVLERAHTSGYRLIVSPLVFNGRFHLHYYPELGSLLCSLRPDVLHMDEEPYNLATWLGLRAGDAVGARSLFFTWQNLGRRYPWPFRYFEQANYGRAAYALAGNRDAADVLRAKGYPGPVRVIPQFGVDPDILSPACPEDVICRNACELVIGYAGRLVAEKGLEVLVRACAGLTEKGYDWRLCIAGEGPLRDELAAQAAEIGAASRVVFVGRVPSTRVADFYRTLDVLVLPSESRSNWIEQFGRVLIEAMSCEVAVVGSDCGEIPHVIGEAGLVFPEGDADSLCGVLAQLADDPALRIALAKRGRQRVLAHFTHAQIASDTAQVYREMLA